MATTNHITPVSRRRAMFGALIAPATLGVFPRFGENRPDGELLDLCAAIPALRNACNALPDHVECEDGQPNWDAYTSALDRIYEIDPQTLQGVIAKARVAKAEAVAHDDSLPIRVIESLIAMEVPHG